MQKMENFNQNAPTEQAPRTPGRSSAQGALKPIFSYSEGQRVYRLTLLFAFVCAIICFSIATIKEHQFVPVTILPAVWFLLLCINFPLRKHISYISVIVICAALSFRYALYPVAVMLDIASSHSRAYDTEAVMLMLSELVGANLVIAFFARKLDIPDTKKDTKGKLGPISGLLISLAVLSVLAYPQLLLRFSISKSDVIGASVPHIVLGFYRMGSWAMIVFILTLLSKLRASSRGLLYLFSAIFAGLVCVQYLLSSVLLSGGGVSRWTILTGCISLGYVFLTLFPHNRKFVVRLIGLGVVAGIFFGTFAKFKQEASVEDFRDNYLLSVHSLDCYFGGIRNIRDGLNATENHYSELRSVSAVATTVFMNMPVGSRFFPDATKTDVVSYYNRYVDADYLICPLVVQSVAHFGKLGSCVLAMIFTYLAIYFNVLCRRTANLSKAFVCLHAGFFCAIFVCLNTRVILSSTWMAIIFILLMSFEEVLRKAFARR